MKKRYYLAVVIVVFTICYFLYEISNPVRGELSQIKNIAEQYKTKNGNYGIIRADQNKKSCFSGNTFVKNENMQKVLSGPDVENISCVFTTSTSTSIVEDWSITIVKGGKAYCEDSTGIRLETPGLTTSHSCKN